MDESLLRDEQLDRLVDGELTGEEYRQLLASLDDEPGGWRRCGLAFLEAQALQRDLGEVVAAIPSAGRPVAPSVSAAPRGRRAWPLWLAMAGCFLIAFTIGSLVPSFWFAPSDKLATPAHPADPAEDAVLPRPADETPNDGWPGSNLAEGPATNRQIRAPENGAPWDDRPGEMMVLEFGDGEGVRRYEVPYYEVDEYEPARNAGDRPLLPDGFVRALRRTGHELRRRHQVIPVPLDNGRSVLVPMEEAEIVPVSGRGYQ